MGAKRNLGEARGKKTFNKNEKMYTTLHYKIRFLSTRNVKGMMVFFEEI